MLSGVSGRKSASARRRAATQAGKLGAEVRTARASHGLSVLSAARLAGVSWQTFARVESGDPNVSILSACAVAEAAGIDVVLRAYPGKAPSLRDSGQLGLAEQLRSMADAAWKPTFELPVGAHGTAIDVAFFSVSEILASEIERALEDWQGQFRRADEKRSILAALHQRPVRLVVVVEDTPRNRRILAPHLAVVRQMLLAGSREILKSIRSGEPLGRDGLLWLRRRR